METKGSFAPATVEEARDRYAEAGEAARVVVRETAKAMGFDGEEYDERVTGEVIETARDALFASLLTVHVADRETFETWLDERPFTEGDVTVLGSEHVDNVVWHAAPFADAVVAATFQNEPDAAAGTLRRNAFGRIYRDEL
ncbi:DUF5809 family protein [Haloparvum sedimenti]|uniref:DUF5809 family protein n=1 Tax=Haloparvum sedimenti TaxID=1678448 RepID=UPI00071E9452|nr:DUF5809 family protein [Haloparvum sedimenti]